MVFLPDADCRTLFRPRGMAHDRANCVHHACTSLLLPGHDNAALLTSTSHVLQRQDITDRYLHVPMFQASPVLFHMLLQNHSKQTRRRPCRGSARKHPSRESGRCQESKRGLYCSSFIYDSSSLLIEHHTRGTAGHRSCQPSSDSEW